MEPTLEQIRTIAKEGDYRRIPVKKELFADHITPTEALRALRGASHHCFLLESAEANGARGRYTFLGFEPLMFVPIATSPILPGVLDKDEIAWLNDYHRQVFAKLAPHLNDEERSWLAEKCAAIGC